MFKNVHLIKSAKVHGAPVDAAAEFADVDHIAVAGHAHLLHDVGARYLPGGRGSHLSGVLQLQLKQVSRVRMMILLRLLLMMSKQMPPSRQAKCTLNSKKQEILC